jgi:signal transduction histidine kinase
MAALQPAKTSSPLRALILEDSDDDVLLLVTHLRRSGFELTYRRADSAAGCERALAEEPWDIVFADYQMPQFTALDALKVLHRRRIDIPFIIVSGSIGESAAVEAMRAGAHDFFLKGNLTRLASAVERERNEAEVRRERREAIKELRESQERLRQAVRARDDFLAIASHELKTPLTSLSLQVESILQGPDDGARSILEKQRAKLQSVAHQVTRLTALINNFLEVTKITSRGLHLSPTSFDLRELVDGVVAGLEDMRRRSGSRITVIAEQPAVGTWDRSAMESVLVNLLTNALKYGDGKPVEIELSTLQGTDELSIVISDHGIGIAPKEQERIFYRFERAVPKEHFGGIGLGLWVARQIVEAHRGTITVASRPRRGSIFTVVLPLRADTRSASRGTA